jgi:hypothetical protein
MHHLNDNLTTPKYNRTQRGEASPHYLTKLFRRVQSCVADVRTR